MSFSNHNNLETPDSGTQNWGASVNENFDLIEKGQTIKATAGEALAVGKVVYMNVSERLNLAISPSGTTTASQFLGFTTTAIADEIDGYVQINGNHKWTDWAFTPGPVYLDASTAGGNISTKNINGKADISTAGGNINMGDVNNNADISTAGGNIKVGNITGTADISTAGGNIKVSSVSNSADISTAGGNISIGNIDGNADVSTAGGNISVDKVSGSAEISTAGGNIKLDGATGTVEANTGAGNIKLINIKGSVEANTGAGNIYAELIPEGNNNSELNSGVGDITLKVPETASVTIVATIQVLMWSGDESDLDNINSDFTPTKIDKNKGRKQIEVTYELNGGGNKIELNVALGNINIQKL